jgi:hypothetical protein
MHFEAGAIHLYTEENRKESRPVFTLLLDISVDEVKPPLNQFQATIADKDGILKLITELFQHDNPNLDKDRIEKTFEKNWKDIEEKIKDIRKVESSTSSPSKTIISSTNEKVSNLKIGHAGYEVLAEVYKNSDQNTGSTTYVDIKNGLREDIQELQLKVILDVLLLEKYIEKDKLGNISAFKLTNFGKTELIRHLYR